MAGIRKNTTVNIIMIMMCVMVIVITSAVENTENIFLLYSDFKQDTIGTISLDGTATGHCFPPDTFGSSAGFAYDQKSNIVYVIDRRAGIYMFPLDGQSLPELISSVPQGNINSIVLDGEGHIFIADPGERQIFRVNTDGTSPMVWVTSAGYNWDVSVDITNRYLIWSELSNYTIIRTPLDDPNAKEIIIQDVGYLYGIHVSVDKLFFCASDGHVMMANTDGTDVQLFFEIQDISHRYITGYGGHIYLTPGWRASYEIYDIYNGSYTSIFNSTTSQPYEIAVVNGQISATACHVSCYNGGSVNDHYETCDCVYRWTGPTCNDCSITCNNGGTVDNTTCTCDCYKHWVGEQCDICNVTCENGTTVDENTCTCECLSQWRGERCEVLQQPTPSEKSPEIVSSSPSFGPAAGGTWITISGTNFPLVYNMSITIADITCDTKLQNTTTVIGITKGLPETDTDLIERPLPVSLKANNTVIVDSEYTFTYKNNPVISKVFPTESIIKGGTLLTVDGNDLDSVAVIWMEVSMILKTLKSDEPLVYDETRTTYATKCQVANSTRMFCPTPVLDVPSGFLNQIPKSTQTKRDVYRYINIGKTNNVRSLGMQHFLSANPSSRIKRETVKLEFSNDGDILEFYIGFRLDGVREYENYTAIDIYTEPTFDFQSSTVMIFKAGERLSFNGEGCDIGITINDYRVNIGKEDCADLVLRSNSLSCYPPQSKPAMDEDESNTEDPQIIIHVGLNLKHFAGYLRYPDPDRTATSTKLPLHIIIPATVVPAIVIIIVIAAVCATQRRRACCQRHE